MEVRIDGWKKAIRFSSAHATLELGKCERLHGHTYVIHANVQGELERRRVVFDFVQLSRVLRAVADELDHYVLVPTESKQIKVRAGKDEVKMDVGDFKYVFPRRDVFLLPRPTSTAEDLADYVIEQVMKRVEFPDTVTKVEIGVDEGYGQGAWGGWARDAKKERRGR